MPFARVRPGRDARVKLLAIDSATERLALAAVDATLPLARATCRIDTLDLDGDRKSVV